MTGSGSGSGSPGGRAAVLALCALAVLAGCSGGAPTVTPAPVPEAGEPVGSSLAPGLSQQGITDPFRLEAAHRQVLTEASFSRHTTETVSREGQPVYESVETVRVSAGGDRYNLSVRQQTSTDYSIRPFASRVRVWGNRSVRAIRLVRIDGIDYRVESGSRLSGDALRDSDRTVELLGAFAVEVTEREAGGYRLTSNRLVAPAALDPLSRIDEVRDASLTAVVTERGLVQRYRVRYEGVDDGDRLTVVLTGRVSGVGTTTVSTPDWVDAAFRADGDTETDGQEDAGPESP